MATVTGVATVKVRTLDWVTNGLQGVQDLPLIEAAGERYVLRDDLVVPGPHPILMHVGSEEGVDGIAPELLASAYRECRVLRVLQETEDTPYGGLPIAVPVLAFAHRWRAEGGEIADAVATAYRMLTDPGYREGLLLDYGAPAGSPTAPPASGTPSWQLLDEMVAGPRPRCAGAEEMTCDREVEIAWRDQVATRWTCAWHWPLAVRARATPVVIAVWDGAAWATWRHEGEWQLYRRACRAFLAAASAVPYRATLDAAGCDTLMDSLYGLLDHNVSVHRFALGVANPGCDPAFLEEALARTRGKISAAGPHDLYWYDLEQVGLALCFEAQEGWNAGRQQQALEAWIVAARGARSAVAMGRLAEVAHAAGDPRDAERWWLESARLGSVAAMTSLGALYADLGDDARSEHWLERAAQAGSATAMYNLGVRAVRIKKLDVARFWFRRARDAGDEQAALVLVQLPAR